MKNLIQKICIVLGIVGLIVPTCSTTTATDWFDSTSKEFGKNINDSVDINVVRTDVDESTGSTILDVIQTAINWILGMLSFVALILCLRGGFQMLTAAGDDSKVKAGTKVLKNAAIGLAVIGLSWLVVSFVFRIIKKVTTATGG